MTRALPISLARAERIVAEVAADHVLAPEEITSRSRRHYIVEARSEAAYRLWRDTELTLREIGEVMGVRDHSSVIYLVRRHQLRAGR